MSHNGMASIKFNLFCVRVGVLVIWVLVFTVEVYINIFYAYTQQYSTIVSNYIFYLVRGNMFRLLVHPSSGQLHEQPKHVATH